MRHIATFVLLLCVAGCLLPPDNRPRPPKPDHQAEIERIAANAVRDYVAITAKELDQLAEDIEAGKVTKASQFAAELKPAEEAKGAMFDRLYEAWNQEFAEDLSKAPKALRESAQGLRGAVK